MQLGHVRLLRLLHLRTKCSGLDRFIHQWKDQQAFAGIPTISTAQMTLWPTMSLLVARSSRQRPAADCSGLQQPAPSSLARRGTANTGYSGKDGALGHWGGHLGSKQRTCRQTVLRC